MRSFAAVLLTLLVTTTAFGATFETGGPRSTNNDDSCDISLLPAATLLLPYFEVDLGSAGAGETTLFTVANVTNSPRVARVTLWTDYSYPVVNFFIYLTGYDVQSINLYDLIQRGVIAPELGTGSLISPEGPLSTGTTPELDENACAELPGVIPPIYVNLLRQAFTTGRIPAFGSAFPGCATAGGVHENAVGYATIDLVRNCELSSFFASPYYSTDLRFDNVLTGDYQQVDPANDYAQSSPLVHIRAIPEGGSSLDRRVDPQYTVNLPRTFYSRYQNDTYKKLDGRQPLPSRFAARWIEGTGAGFQTSFKIWREPLTGVGAACADFPKNFADATEVVTFDEEENFEGQLPQPICCFELNRATLPSSSLVEIGDDEVFPQLSGGQPAGWVYMNLDHPGDSIASQAWVVTSMRSQNLYSADTDATALGNGCSPFVSDSNANDGTIPIGPSPNGN